MSNEATLLDDRQRDNDRLVSCQLLDLHMFKS